MTYIHIYNLGAPHKIFPLGDAAAVLDLGNTISVELNQKVLAIQRRLQKKPFTGLKDIMVAYSSLTVLYDPVTIKRNYSFVGTAFDWVSQMLQDVYEQSYSD